MPLVNNTKIIDSLKNAYPKENKIKKTQNNTEKFMLNIIQNV